MGAFMALFAVNAIEIEREPLLSWAPTKCWPPQSSPCGTEIKKDYFVPNFGVDSEIMASTKHIKDAEKNLKHKWTPKMKTKDMSPPINYAVPNYGMDKDIKDTIGSIKSTEAKLGNWNPSKDEDGAYIVPTPFDNKSYGYTGKI